MPNDRYWASCSGLELAQEAHERVRSFYSDLPKRIMYQRWGKAYRTYYGLSGQDDPFDISRPGIAGDEGQLTSIKVNHAGSIMRRQVALVSQTVPEFEPIPANTDYDTLADVSFTRKILDYYMDTREVGARLFDTAQGAGIFGESRLEIAWDAKAGPKLPPVIGPDGNPAVDPETGQPVPPDPNIPGRTNTGDLAFRMYTPLDLVRDLTRYDMDDEWMITRRFVNRWNLVARYPSLADQIQNLRPDNWPQSVAPTDRLQWERQWSRDKSDEIPLYTLYHKQTDALPNGKIAEFLGSDILLYEGNLPYEEVPLVPIAPGKMLRAPYGESPFHHLLALQDIYDMLASSVASNNAALALHLLFMPDELDFSHMEFSEGFAVLRGSSGPAGNLKPEVLNFNAPNDVALKFMEMIKSDMEQIGGVNSTMRGAPPPNVLSGSFGALIAQQALEYAGAFQYSFQQAVAKTGNLIVSILKQYADQPIVAEIAGEAHNYQLASFTKSKLESIHRVIVKSGNPAARTPQFNIAMASDLLQKGLIPDAKTYITLVRTGEVDTVMDDVESDQMRIRRENEMLAQGQQVTVLATDSHREDIIRHKGVLSSPAARDNPQVVGATLEHINQHILALQEVNPALLAILGEPSLAPLGPPPGGPPPGHGGEPGGASPPGPPQHGGPPTKGPPTPPHAGGPGPLPHQPNQPINPITHAPASPNDGALRS